ncbi:hypothetical protein DEU56DRAFT_803507 [Suillus clintonianus]|uniref:uncharacterized protein n=1 Tax=Suillus clintonianus TaxID=1904413 RepID=UPI001B86F1E4|nr:uncharacterized protein DEU56DRAFT_803507 [Suillus clintonianus]KAG2137984.1 hypothetical protein DEU56DRAFT_803507 [Suillus clintonianus]
MYVKLLERGIDGVMLDLARGMEAFWAVVRERWGELWDALRVEGEGLGRDDVSHASHIHSNSYDITGRRRSGSTNDIPTGPIIRKPFDESLRSDKSGKSGKSLRNSPATGTGRGIEDVPPIPSVLQPPSQSRSSVSHPRLKPARMKSLPGPIFSNIPFGLDPPTKPKREDNDRDRGRGSQRRPSLKSKFKDAFRPSQHRRRNSHSHMLMFNVRRSASAPAQQKHFGSPQ